MSTKQKPLVMDFTDDYDHSQKDAVTAIGLVITDKEAYEAEAIKKMEIVLTTDLKNSQAIEVLDNWDIPVRLKYLHLISAFQNTQRVLHENAAELAAAKMLLKLAEVALHGSKNKTK